MRYSGISPCVLTVRITFDDVLKRLRSAVFFAHLQVRYNDRVRALAACYQVFIVPLVTPLSAHTVIIVVGCRRGRQSHQNYNPQVV